MLTRTSIMDVRVGQPAFAPVVVPTRDNPVHVFTGFWIASDYTARSVPIETVNIDGFYVYYDANFLSRPLDPVSAGAGMVRVCYADCDESGTLDFFDFLCFQNAFLARDPYADCDGDGVFDFLDFLCFQNEFLAGCP